MVTEQDYREWARQEADDAIGRKFHLLNRAADIRLDCEKWLAYLGEEEEEARFWEFVNTHIALRLKANGWTSPI
jgi:hypothetical protein